MIWENVKMAFRSIAANKLRTSLTMLGLVIGISSVVTINAVGEGVKKSVTAQVDELGANLIQINPGSSDVAANFVSSLGSSTLTERDVEDIKKVSGVEAAAPAMLISGSPSYQQKQGTGGITFATTSEYAKAVKTDLEFGSFLSSDGQNEVVLGYGIAEKLFGSPSQDNLGKEVEIRGQKFTVVGVTKKPEEGGFNFGPGLDSAVYISFAAGKEFSGGSANINEIEVKAANANEVNKIKDEIKKTLKENHGGQEDFSVSEAKEQLKIFENILGVITAFVAAIASIALLVGGIGIMNIMLVSVTERTHEIGLRKALGANRSTILGQFLIEAMVICLIGGLLGIVFAYVGAFAVGSLAGIDPVVTLPAIAYAVGVSVLVGIIFGIAPAIKAARMRPIEALHYE